MLLLLNFMRITLRYENSEKNNFRASAEFKKFHNRSDIKRELTFVMTPRQASCATFTFNDISTRLCCAFKGC